MNQEESNFTAGDWAALTAAMREQKPEAAKRHRTLKPQHRKQVRKAFLLAGGWSSPDPVGRYADATLTYYTERRERQAEQLREQKAEKLRQREIERVCREQRVCRACGQPLPGAVR